MDVRRQHFALAGITLGKEPLAALNRILCPGIFHNVVVRLQNLFSCQECDHSYPDIM
jgi:hypothetical protein